ncbi:uncharacterized protein LOC110981476 [Acanthaster planci]|uniref:Uncharacterized protein LOC110981476 n=1 Tax=Acanthaster planci TaxID=133434 RepID=A0A8B7YNC1_ACAPL|nr:uncharacterized protein LOC110981476 [Acanthaster planci]XP_022094765.1 uncharacterized protein LOC110981476 [Acanthaster planci]
MDIAVYGSKKMLSPRQRRGSYYKKKGRQGRRTKLTGGLLRAISEILAEMDILSISHLSQELLNRGHSLSRSTVFRAMETLGLRVDRDRKVWCAGPVGTEAGELRWTAKHSNGDDANSTTPALTRNNSVHADAGFLPGRAEDSPPLLLNDISYSQQTEYRDPKLQCTANRDSVEAENTANGLYTPTNNDNTGVTRGATRGNMKQEINDQNPASEEFELTQSTGGQETLCLADRWTDTVRDGVRRVSMTSLVSAQRRGRKRKSDCPAKFGSPRNLKVDSTSYWPSTASPSRQATRTFEAAELYSSKTEDDQWIPSKSSVKAKQASTSSSGVYGREAPELVTEQILHLQENQPRRNLITEKRPAGFQGRAEPSLLSKTTLRHSSSKDSLILEPEAFQDETMDTDRANPINGTSGYREELVGCQEWKDKLMLCSRELMDSTSKKDNVHSSSTFTFRRGYRSKHCQETRDSLEEDLLLGESAPQRQQLQKSGSQQLPVSNTDTQKELMHKDAGHQMQGQAVAANCRLNRASNEQPVKTYDSRWSGAEVNRQRHSDQYLGRPSRKASQFLPGDQIQNKTRANLTIPSFQNIPTEQKTSRENDPQTARLHALTSSLAAKTSSVLGIEIGRRGREQLDKLTSDSASNNLISDLSAGKNKETSFQTNKEPLVKPRGLGQKAVSKSSLPSANGHGTYSPSPQDECIQSQHNTNGGGSAPASSSVTQCFSMFLPELQSWMQFVSDKLASMEDQLQYLTEIITQPAEKTEEAEPGTVSAESDAIDSLKEEEEEEEEEEEGRDEKVEEAGEEDPGQSESEKEPEGQTWETTLPPINTPESNDMIKKIMSDERWNTFSPYVGGPRLAIRLARDCIFGSEVLSKSTVTGRNGMNPLQRDGIKKIKECLMKMYGPKCSGVECEILWKMARESLSQLCKRTRRQFAAEASNQDVDDPDYTP